MSTVIYRQDEPQDRTAVIDFINYVFSEAYCPHDFKKLFPAVYADHLESLTARHFMAIQNGGIRGLVAVRVHRWHVFSDTLTLGTIGNVAVHPYARGEGHMKRLMSDAIEDARTRGCDLLILRGQRQRYNHFGFEQAGWSQQFTFTQASVRHALGDLDSSNVQFSSLTPNTEKELDYACALYAAQPVRNERLRKEFLDIVHELGRDCRLILIDGRMSGYIIGRGEEIILELDSDLPRIIKALFEQDKLDSITISVPPWQRKRMEILSAICDNCHIVPSISVHVLSWRKTLEVLLRLKSTFTHLQDGKLILSIAGEKFSVRVTNGKLTVTDSDQVPDIAFDQLEAERTLCGLESLSTGGIYRNWFPLPIYFLPPDEF